MAEQLPLLFPHRPSYEAADFVPAPSNEAALAWLDRTEDWPDHRLALWGEAGCGKTHLLHVWAERRGAALLAGWDVRGLPAGLSEALPDLPVGGGIALDDAEAIADEVRALHLLNAAREARLPVLLASRAPPARWPVRLADLASRLRAITAVEIRPPEDSLLHALLTRLLLDRRLAVRSDLQEWLLRRLPRSAAGLRDAAARLDGAAFAAGGKVTRTIAVAVVEEMAAVTRETESG